MSWTAREIEAKLRRLLCISEIEVKQDAAWAVRHGFHRDVLQVWDRAPQTGEPYVVDVLHRNGFPCEPTDAFWMRLWRARADHVHMGKKGWPAEVERQARAWEQGQEDANFEKAHRGLYEHEDRIRHLLRLGRVYGTTGRRHMRRTRAGLLVPA